MVTRRTKVLVKLTDAGESHIVIYIAPEQLAFLRGVAQTMEEHNPSMSRPIITVEEIKD